MKLPEYTEQDAEQNGNYLDEMTHERQIAMDITDDFEDFLDGLDVTLPNRERDENQLTGEESNLYGQQYDDLVNSVRHTIENCLENISVDDLVEANLDSLTFEQKVAIVNTIQNSVPNFNQAVVDELNRVKSNNP